MSRKHEKRKIYLIVGLLLIVAIAFLFVPKESASNQLFLINEDGSIREVEAKSTSKREHLDEAARLENGLNELKYVDVGNVAIQEVDGMLIYFLTLLGEGISSRYDEILSYLNQHIESFSIKNVDYYEDTLLLELVLE